MNALRKTSVLASLIALAGFVFSAVRADKPSSIPLSRIGYDTLIAHRGESDDAPENTLPAYKMAVDRGFGFECDVYLSKDGRVFTFHDRDLKRTTAGANTNKCADVTWDEISRLDVGGWGKWKGSKYSPTRPALLEEVLTLARDGRYIYVEVKPGPEIVPHIRKVFAAQKKATPRNTLFISFEKATCKALKEQMPEYKVYWITSSKHWETPGYPPVTAKDVIAAMRETGADGVDCHFDPTVVTPEMVAEVRKAGYEFHVWTVDRLEDTEEAFWIWGKSSQKPSSKPPKPVVRRSRPSPSPPGTSGTIRAALRTPRTFRRRTCPSTSRAMRRFSIWQMRQSSESARIRGSAMRRGRRGRARRSFRATPVWRTKGRVHSTTTLSTGQTPCASRQAERCFRKRYRRRQSLGPGSL